MHSVARRATRSPAATHAVRRSSSATALPTCIGPRNGVRPSSSSRSGGASSPSSRGAAGSTPVCSSAQETGSAPTAVLAEALERRPNRGKRGGRALPLAVLAGLRLRQGRMEDAATLLDGLDDEPAAIAPLVELSLERGDAAYAHALLDRRPDADEGVLLVLEGRLALATGDLDGAKATAERLHDVAAATGRADLAAEAALLEGRTAAAEGDLAAATAALEEAVVRFSTLQSRSRPPGRAWPSRASRRHGWLAAGAVDSARLRATPSRSSAPAPTPTGRPRCCASSVSRVARRPGASATSSRRASARCWAWSPRGCRTPRSRSGS